MQVILLETIQKIGALGDLANVKAGYARNFLIPQGKAKPATKANLAEFETLRAGLEAKEAALLKDAQSIEEKMAGTVCTIGANAGEAGKLFGSVNTADIAQSLAKAGFEVEKRSIILSEAIRYIGEYDVSVNLHTTVVVNIKVIVEMQEEA
jgi:large subunit ribosomal protein L9